MSEIRPVTWELSGLELLKLTVFNLVSVIETKFCNQSGP